MFAIAPLLLVALVAWVSIGAPRPWPSRLVATAVSPSCSSSRFRIPASSTSRPSRTRLRFSPSGRPSGASRSARSGSACCSSRSLLSAVFLLVPARWAVLVPVAVLVWFGLVGSSVWSGPRGFVQAGAGALFQGIRGVPRDWIDEALPDGATTGIVWTGLTDRFTVNQNEFFNRAVGPVYYTGGPSPGNLPETAITVDPATGFSGVRTGRLSPIAT